MRFFILLLLLISSTLGAYQYDLSICMVFRDEAPYLKEWIEFHKLVGVQHFYLINHLSKDDYLSILQPYIDHGEIELFQLEEDYGIPIEWAFLQTHTYDRIIAHCKNQTKWLAILDSDEFLYPEKGDNLLDVLNDYEQFGGVYVFWQMFGTSNIEKIPDNKLLIETLTMRSEDDYFWNHWGKSIVRPEYVYSCDIHFHRYFSPFFHVFTNKTRIPDYDTFSHQHLKTISKFPIIFSKLKINHYWTRDEYYLYNCKFPRYDRWTLVQDALNRMSQLNVIESNDILRFVPALYQAMGLPFLEDFTQ